MASGLGRLLTVSDYEWRPANRPQLSIESMAEHIPALKRELDQIEDRKEEIIEAAEIQIQKSTTC